jgi:GAF domain-containing protein
LRLGPYAGEPRDHPSVAFGEALTGRAAEQRDAFAATDLQELASHEVGHEDMRSELAVPVLDGEELAGSLDVASHLPAAFDDDVLTFLRRVGELTGPLAMQRGREA